MITQERLKEVLDYNRDTGEFFWKKQISNRIKVGNLAGNYSYGYREISIDKRPYKVHQLVWFLENGYIPENDLDHINRIRNDNRIENLREVSRQCNMRNSGLRKDNTSGIKGVHWNKKDNAWESYITINQKRERLGRFQDFTEAVCHRLAAEQYENWSGCDSSSSAYRYINETS